MRAIAAILLSGFAAAALPSCGGPSPDPHSADAYERYLGIVELGEAPTSENIQLVLKRLNDSSPLVREGCLLAIRKFGKPELSIHAAEHVDDPHPLVRQRAIEVSAAFVSEAALPKITAALLGDPDTAVRRTAARALRQYGNRRDVIEALVDALADAEAGVAYNAYLSLTALTGEILPQEKAAWEKKLKGP